MLRATRGAAVAARWRVCALCHATSSQRSVAVKHLVRRWSWPKDLEPPRAAGCARDPVLPARRIHPQAEPSPRSDTMPPVQAVYFRLIPGGLMRPCIRRCGAAGREVDCDGSFHRLLRDTAAAATVTGGAVRWRNIYPWANRPKSSHFQALPTERLTKQRRQRNLPGGPCRASREFGTRLLVRQLHGRSAYRYIPLRGAHAAAAKSCLNELHRVLAFAAGRGLGGLIMRAAAFPP